MAHDANAFRSGRLIALAMLLTFALPARMSFAQQPATAQSISPQTLPLQIPDFTKPENFASTIQVVALITVLSLAPAILLMVTSFTRIMIVLSLLRQAIGAQQLPPNQVLVGLSLFMTFLIMGPTWQRVNKEALQPYMSGTMNGQTALERGVIPVRQFMAAQI